MSVEILDLAALALTAVFFALLYYLHKKKHVDFGVRTILAVGLGLIVGLVFKGHHTYVSPPWNRQEFSSTRFAPPFCACTTSSALPPLPPLWLPPKASWTRLCTMARSKHLLPRQSEHFSKCF